MNQNESTTGQCRFYGQSIMIDGGGRNDRPAARRSGNHALRL